MFMFHFDFNCQGYLLLLEHFDKTMGLGVKEA